VQTGDAYLPDLSDPMDISLAKSLQALGTEDASKLAIVRHDRGAYEIDKRRVTVVYGNSGIMVKEHGDCASEIAETPLRRYLQQAAHVAAQMSRMPLQRQLTFVDTGHSHNHQTEENAVWSPERVTSMRIACEQAGLREKYANAYK